MHVHGQWQFINWMKCGDFLLFCWHFLSYGKSSAKFSPIHVVSPLVKVNMSLFSVCQLRLMGVLTLKTGQKGIGKKKQQPLLKRS